MLYTRHYATLIYGQSALYINNELFIQIKSLGIGQQTDYDETSESDDEFNVQQRIAAEQAAREEWVRLFFLNQTFEHHE